MSTKVATKKPARFAVGDRQNNEEYSRPCGQLCTGDLGPVQDSNPALRVSFEADGNP